MKILKGDTVKILIGRDAGKTGKVLRADSKNHSILVEGLNLLKRHVRPKKQGEKGQIISLPAPLNISKAMLLCPSCKKATRVGYRIEKGDTKSRYCKKCNSVI